jgi:hypothetical protein
MAKTITKFKTVRGNPVTFVAANVFSVKPFEGLPLQEWSVPDGAVVYDVMSPAGASELIVQLPGDSVSQYITEAGE